MKEIFVEKKFGADSETMIQTINTILLRYEEQGYDLSLRQLYYQLVQANIVPNTERSYKNVGTLVSDARLAGRIDWNMIKDRGREMTQNPHWADPATFVKEAAPQFRVDHWADQPCYVEVMVEKQALEGVLEPVCRSLDVPFTANKGYSSSSALYEAGKRMAEHLYNEKPVYVVYLGDHDPSGIDMSRDVEDRLRLFAKCAEGDECTVTVNRVALNMDQIRRYQPPENPAKITDSRAEAYISRFGNSSWELDALEPRVLARLVTDAVQGYMDTEKFEACAARQEAGRAQLTEAASKFEE